MRVRVTLDDLRPGVAEALRALAESEGGALRDDVTLGVSIDWKRDLFDHARWQGRLRKGHTASEKADALCTRFGYFFGRWRAAASPRPKLTAEWQDDELAMMALTGETVPGGWFIRLVRPNRASGSSIRECAVCGASIEAKRAGARTCSARCRQRLSRGAATRTAPQR